MKNKKTSKVVIVTGASGGIGSSICTGLIKRGFRVIGIDQKAKVISKKVMYEHITADLEKYVLNLEYQKKINQKIINFTNSDQIYALINNAAIQTKKKLEITNTSDWSRSLNVNVLAPFFLSKCFLKSLRDSRGYIVNISSIHEKLSKQNFGLYAVSKSALSSLSRAMVLEWGSVVKVITISPAAIDTPMLQSGFDEDFRKIKPKLEQSHPSGSIGCPIELTNLINFILSGEIDFINGANIHLDGGISHKLYELEG